MTQENNVTRRQALATMVNPRFIRAVVIWLVLERFAAAAEAAGLRRVPLMRYKNHTGRVVTIDELLKLNGVTMLPDPDYWDVGLWLIGARTQLVGSPIHARRNHLYVQVNGQHLVGVGVTILTKQLNPGDEVVIRRHAYSRARARRGVVNEPPLSR